MNILHGMKNLLNSKFVRLAGLGIILVVSLACSYSIPGFTATQLPPGIQSVQLPSASPTPLRLPESINDEQTVLVTLYSQINPAVVNITVYTRQGSQILPYAQGSGFVYDEKGNIITNAHVVHGSDQSEVTFSDGTILTSTIVGEDLNSDLAVVKVDHYPAGVRPIPLGNMDNLAVGQTVIAIGNPFGLEGTLTRGIISALGRSIPALTPFTIPQAIQTDAAINPGNSGGPLLNLQGEVIGVNSQIETGSTNAANSGVGFAVPVSILRLVIPELIENGQHDWAWLGVRGGNLNPLVRQAMKLEVEKGAYIAEVVEGGPSSKAGLKGSTDTRMVDGRQIELGGDVVVGIDDQPVASFDDLLVYIALKAKPGQEVKLTIIRNGKSMELKVLLEARPENLAE